jgi:penicillin-binding protein 2
MCENAGFGAQSAAPIASLLIEQYLHDSIAGTSRKALVEEVSKRNLIPKLMRLAMERQDSIKQAKLNAEFLLQKANKEAGDTLETEEEQPDSMVKTISQQVPKKDTTHKKTTTPAVLTDERRKLLTRKTVKT